MMKRSNINSWHWMIYPNSKDQMLALLIVDPNCHLSFSISVVHFNAVLIFFSPCFYYKVLRILSQARGVHFTVDNLVECPISN